MAAQPWSREASTQLIELYSGYPCLYDITSKDYHNRYKRQFALEELVKLMAPFRPNMTASEVQSKINGLRTQFLSALNKVRESKKSGCSREDIFIPTLWCYNQLKFLEPYTIHHKGQSNLSMNSEAIGSQARNEESNQFDETFESMLDKIGDDEDEPHAIEPSSKAMQGQAPFRKPTSAEKGKKRKAPDSTDNVDDLLVNASNALKSISNQKSSPPEDEWDLFGRFVANEMRNMKVRLNQKQLKRTIQMAILDAYEEEP